MVKSLLNVVIGFLGVLILLVFSVLYGFLCILLGWYPDISVQTWAGIVIGLSAVILLTSFCFWRFTGFKEGLHGWILVPGLFLGKFWFYTVKSFSFGDWLKGTLYLSLIFLILACVEMGRDWYLDQNRVKAQENNFMG